MSTIRLNKLISANGVLEQVSQQSGDNGTLIKRYQTVDGSSDDIVSDSPNETSSGHGGNAQAGDLTNITLNSGASAVDDYYNGWWIHLTVGSGNGQIRRIKDFTGSTRVATIYSTSDNNEDGLDFVTSASTDTEYSLFNRSYVGSFYDESEDVWKIGFMSEVSQNIKMQDKVNLHVNNLTLDGVFSGLGNSEFEKITVDTDNTEALLVRKDGDGGDVFSVDTTNDIVTVTGNLTVTGTVDGRDIATDGSNLDNLNTTIGLSALTSAEVDQLENINSTTISGTQWGYLGTSNQGIATSDSVSFSALAIEGDLVIDNTSTKAFLVRKDGFGGDLFGIDTVNSDVGISGTLSITGTVDGRDVATDGSTLDNLNNTIGLSALTSAEVDQLENINSTTISGTQWGYLGSSNQGIATSDTVSFNGLTLEGSQIIDNTSTEALLVRKDGDGGDIFVVDTINSQVKFVDSQFYATLGSGNPEISFDPNDYLTYNRTSNEYSFISNSIAILQINSGGIDVTGDIIVSGTRTITTSTVDGSDDGRLKIAGGGGSSDRGARIVLSGNERASVGGWLELFAGDSGKITLSTGNDEERIIISETGDIWVQDNPIYFRGVGDTNHGVRWSDPAWGGIGTDSVVLFGYSNILLGTTNGGEHVHLHCENNSKETKIRCVPATGSNTTGLIDIRPSHGDISETNYQNSTDVNSSPVDVTGLLFDSTNTRSFKAIMSVEVNASTNLFAQFELRGLQKSGSWIITSNFIGDDTQITISINGTGQIQFTSTSITGFTSRELSFRAWATSRQLL
jgi:hypothetical protein